MASSGCCPTDGTAVHMDYEPKGSMEQTGEFLTYVATPPGSPNGAAIVVGYDIFGLAHNQVKQVADRLAEDGFIVVVPDFFRGKPWSLEDFPPKPEQDLRGWVMKAGAWDIVKADLDDVVLPFLRDTKGVKNKIGFVGFCWGGKRAFDAAATGQFAAAACAHPSFLSAADGETLQCPMMCLLSKDEPPLEDLGQVLTQSSPFKEHNVFRRFPAMHHGWMAARGDWSNEQQAAQATEALSLFKAFFTKLLLA